MTGPAAKPRRAGSFTLSSVRDAVFEKRRQADLDAVRAGARSQQAPMAGQATDTVRQAPGIEYEYRPEYQDRPGAGRGPQVGVRAQDLERTPLGAQAVNQGEDGMKQVDPGKLVMVHAAALHEMEQRLQKLEGTKR